VQCVLEVGVRKDDVRVLPAELQGDGREALARGARDLPADGRAPGERQLVDVVVVRQRGPCPLAVARDDVERAVGERRLLGEQLGEPEGADGRLLAGLVDERVPGGERGRELPCEQQ